MSVKRIFDTSVAAIALLVLAIPMACIALAVRLTSNGPALYWSRRVGRDNGLFSMPKFRTMQLNAPVVATHLLQNPESHLTSIGGFLRRTSLDELPQLWCVLRGEMSLVGPRPALFNQDDLIAARTQCNIHRLLPGLTGWAQINGRDELAIPQKVALDEEYMTRKSFTFDMRILFLTVLKVAGASGVKH
ncbi:sugar transferase [Rhizobium sp. FY34]|uniref:sugar transferase n=1 Tax=Rhizobium sp. FY34 TaxID=2562309 RepID=UPI0010C01F2D|nr:sugar transferase [Rhizobium sp. FY34]